MLLKLLLTAGLIYIVYVAFFKKPAIKTASAEKKHGDETTEEMIACAHCGTYTTVEESILSMGKSFCCKECVKEAS